MTINIKAVFHQPQFSSCYQNGSFEIECLKGNVYIRTCAYVYSQIPVNVAARLDNLWELISIDDKSNIVTDSSSIREFSVLRERRPFRLHPAAFAYVTYALS